MAAMMVKTPAEIAHLESCNARSARAIVNTVRWVRERFARNERVSEWDYFEAANAFYAEQGARDQSFQTIAAVGANSAVIHFNSPSADVEAKADDMMLLDSGALYEGGFATDITRTFLAGGERAAAHPEQKRLYTLVLKGLLRAMGAVVPEGTRGSYLDTLAREPIHAAGLDYAHGTGRLGKSGGFSGDKAVYIPLPKSLDKVKSAMKLVGMDGMLQDLELKLNAAAEVATPKAKSLFVDSIKQSHV